MYDTGKHGLNQEGNHQDCDYVYRHEVEEQQDYKTLKLFKDDEKFIKTRELFIRKTKHLHNK